jgi:magnesium-transporting ATPase (P-type)
MNYLKNKKLVLIILLLVVVTFLLAYYSFESKCFGYGCSSNLREALIVPMFWFSLSFAGVISIFLFVSESIFHSWLKKIAWWYLLVTIIILLSTPLYSSNVLTLGRSEIIVNAMAWLGFITVLFVGVHLYLDWKKKK